MKLISILLLTFIFQNNEKVRSIKYQGSEVMTTYGVDAKFLGKYSGSKKGYLILREDGTGEYRYDMYGFALKGCKPIPIILKWGFIYDKGRVVSFERTYGKSYPILLESTSETSFKGCRETVMLDFITDKSGELGVASSDDWIKTK